MRKTIVKFHCDNCNKELTRIKNGNDRDFPWDEGWIELNEIEIGAPVRATHRLIDQPHKIEMSDRDFCGRQCFFDFLSSELDNAAIVRMEREKPKEQHFDQMYPEDESQEEYPRFDEPQPPQPPGPRPEERIEEVQEPKRRRSFFG